MQLPTRDGPQSGSCCGDVRREPTGNEFAIIFEYQTLRKAVTRCWLLMAFR